MDVSTWEICHEPISSPPSGSRSSERLPDGAGRTDVSDPAPQPSPVWAAEPAEVATLRAGLGSLAEVFVGEYEETGPLARPVPLSDTGPAPLPSGRATP